MRRKNLLVVVALVMSIALLAGCGSFFGAKDLTLTVKVTDKYAHALTGTVVLTGKEDFKQTKTGSEVSFAGLGEGAYTVTVTYANTKEVVEDDVYLDDNQVLTAKFDTVSSVDSVEKIILDPVKSGGDPHKLVIPNLGVNEHLVVGVSTLDFVTSSADAYSFGIRLTRGDSADSQSISLSPMSIGNPEYVYTPAPKVDAPKIKSMDIELRQNEGVLIQQLNSDTTPLPSFGPNEYQLNDAKDFKFQNFETDEWVTINTTVKAVGEHCYVFVEDGSTLDQATIDKYVEEFDNNIYPKNTSFYNDKFDIDGNNKLGIVLFSMQMTNFDAGIIMGYFYGVDYYSQDELDAMVGPGQFYSNEGDFIYLNTQALDQGFAPEDHFSTIAHEFQHELYFYSSWDNGWLDNESWVSDTWINEGMSTFAEQLNGYNTGVDDRVYIYFDNDDPISQRTWLIDTSQESLTCWDGNLSDYGISNLFTNYIVEQFGEGVLHQIYADNKNPVESITEYTGMNFEDIFMNFVIANKLHSLDLAPEYSYQLPLEADPAHSFVTSNYQGISYFFRPSAVKYFVIDGTGTDVQLEFLGTAKTEKLGVFTYRY